MVTTGEIDWRNLRVKDPLHGIDLSDPFNPRELSELIIPGFTSYLQKIDATHWIGLGFTVARMSDGFDTLLFRFRCMKVRT